MLGPPRAQPRAGVDRNRPPRPAVRHGAGLSDQLTAKEGRMYTLIRFILGALAIALALAGAAMLARYAVSGPASLGALRRSRADGRGAARAGRRAGAGR